MICQSLHFDEIRLVDRRLTNEARLSIVFPKFGLAESRKLYLKERPILVTRGCYLKDRVTISICLALPPNLIFNRHLLRFFYQY